MLSEITNLNGSQGGKSGKGSKKSSKKTSSGDKVISQLTNHRGAAGCFKGNIVVKGKLHAQKANDQETVMEGHDSASVLCQFHKEVTEF